MDASDRAQQDDADGGDSDAGTASPDTDREGTLRGTGTSVRAHWRIETMHGAGSSGPDARVAEAVALVQLRLRNPAEVAQRVSVRNTLDGPVLFPRREGVPEAGWDREGFVGVVDADSQRALGYACPASIRTPPIALRQAEGGGDGRASDSSVERPTPEAVVRTYGDSDPPTVVPGDAEGTSQQITPETRPQSAATAPVPDAATPPAVAAWLDEIEDRIARAEALDGATVAEATTVLVESGGLDPALDDIDRLSTSAERLQALAERANELAERAENAEVSRRALRRLA